MRRKLIFLYSGQGSQYYQMGREIFETDSVYRNELSRLDHILREIYGYSIIEEIFRNDKKKTETFEMLKYSHPAIYMSQIALSKALLQRRLDPDYYMGLSLGEIVAMSMATGNIDEIFLNTVSQCDLFLKCKIGGMIAVFSDVDNFNKIPEIYENSHLAAVNYKKMYVISGDLEGLDKVERYFKKEHILHQRLPVQYAFHSKCINAIKEYLLCEENLYLVNKPRIPIISCCMNEHILEEIPIGYLWHIIRKTIDFYGTMNHLIELDENYLFIDLSFTGSQANYIRRIVDTNNKIKVYSPFTLLQNSNDLNNVANEIKTMLAD